MDFMHDVVCFSSGVSLKSYSYIFFWFTFCERKQTPRQAYFVFNTYFSGVNVLACLQVKITLGKKGDKWPYAGAIDKATEWGCECVEMEVDEVCVDDLNKIVTTPAFMYEGDFHEIQDGVSKMIEELVKLA